jgi:hypothetical protein
MTLTATERATLLTALTREIQSSRLILKNCGPNLALIVERQVNEYEGLRAIISNADSIEIVGAD